jgi:hypothetical protein
LVEIKDDKLLIERVREALRKRKRSNQYYSMPQSNTVVVTNSDDVIQLHPTNYQRRQPPQALSQPHIAHHLTVHYHP